MVKNFFILLLSLLTTFNLSLSGKTKYDYLLEWGKNNSVYISKKIRVNYTNENTKNFYVKKKINPGEILISIPQSLLLNINSALKLSSTKIQKQFEKYKKQKFKQIKNNDSEIFNQRIENSFLAYLMTMANNNKSKKNKLYQYYKYFFDSCETNFDKFPLFYSTSQISSFLFSLFGNELVQTKATFEEEYMILQSQTKKQFDLDEYLKYRLFTYNKLVNISGESSIVPFIDIIDYNPVIFNLQVNYTIENKSISVTANQEINPNEKLVLAVVEMTNMASFIIYGKTYEESKNYLETFKIAKISGLFLKEKNLNPMLSNPNLMDIMKPKFYEEVIPDYIKLSKMLNGDGNSVSALKLLIENLECFRRQYDEVTMSVLMKNFFDLETVQNIKSILDTEKYFLDKVIGQFKKILSYVDTNKENQNKENKSDL